MYLYFTALFCRRINGLCFTDFPISLGPVMTIGTLTDLHLIMALHFNLTPCVACRRAVSYEGAFLFLRTGTRFFLRFLASPIYKVTRW